jgi:hypothetical protein
MKIARNAEFFYDCRAIDLRMQKIWHTKHWWSFEPSVELFFQVFFFFFFFFAIFICRTFILCLESPVFHPYLPCFGFSPNSAFMFSISGTSSFETPIILRQYWAKNYCRFKYFLHRHANSKRFAGIFLPCELLQRRNAWYDVVLPSNTMFNWAN